MSYPLDAANNAGINVVSASFPCAAVNLNASVTLIPPANGTNTTETKGTYTLNWDHPVVGEGLTRFLGYRVSVREGTAAPVEYTTMNTTFSQTRDLACVRITTDVTTLYMEDNSTCGGEVPSTFFEVAEPPSVVPSFEVSSGRCVIGADGTLDHRHFSQQGHR